MKGPLKGKRMLTMTEAAGAFLVDVLGDAGAPDGVAVRLVADKTGLSVRLDNHRAGDESFDHEGRTVLLLDETVAPLLAAKTLDVEPSGEGPALSLR